MEIEAGEIDVIDSIRARQKLNASQVTYVIEMLISASGIDISLLDPGFIPIYMRSNEMKPRNTMARYFIGDRQRSITVIPIHNNDHWSLLVYVSRLNVFYHFDSLDEYHDEYIVSIIKKMVADQIITATTDTQLVSIENEGQVSNYECGQYLFMFLYAFFTRYSTAHANTNRESLTCDLQAYVRESCREAHRQKFMLLVIHWIHESRGY